MTQGARRGVTRAYVVGLIFVTLVVAAAILIASWGGILLLSGAEPYTTRGIPRWIAPTSLIVGLGIIAWSMWRQALTLLRGRRSPSWGSIVVTALAFYVVWAVFGFIAGAGSSETWLSPYAATLPVIGLLAGVMFWAILARRVYTDRPTPKWPWERGDDLGPDWAIFGEDPWRQPPADDTGEDRDGERPDAGGSAR